MMFIHCCKFTLLCCLILFPAACATGTIEEGQPLPKLTFRHLPPVSLDISGLDVVTSYDSTRMKDDISDQLPIPPDVAIRRYIRQRFIPEGDSGTIEMDIQQAHVTKTIHEPEGLFSGWFGLNRQEQYDAYLKIHVVMRNRSVESGQRTVSKTSTLTAHRNLTIPESISLAERDARQLEMVEKLINEIDPIMIESMVNTFEIADPREKTMSPLPEMRRDENEDRKELKPAQ